MNVSLISLHVLIIERLSVGVPQQQLTVICQSVTCKLVRRISAALQFLVDPVQNQNNTTTAVQQLDPRRLARNHEQGAYWHQQRRRCHCSTLERGHGLTVCVVSRLAKVDKNQKEVRRSCGCAACKLEEDSSIRFDSIHSIR